VTNIQERDLQILVAGVGNAWMRDDGFGGQVIARLIESELPAGVRAEDYGTGGLDLAYEVMRGYDALILLDISRQDGEPGTLYVMEPDEASISAAVQDGEVLDPHGMDPQTVLRFVRMVGGWPGKVIVIACEPAVVEEMGMGLSEPVAAAVERAVTLTRDTIAEMRATMSVIPPPDTVPVGLAQTLVDLPSARLDALGGEG
jgi:hydrogenase maturation protease